MHNSKGSILTITVGFALVFTMLGIASIYISTLHSETQEKEILSQKAFWLAEAGLNRALTASSLPDNGNSIVLSCGESEELCSANRSYSVLVEGKENDIAGNRQGDITSTGLDNNFQRRVWARVVRTLLGIDTILKSPGSLDQFGASGVVGKIETYSDDVNNALFLDIFGVDKLGMKSTYYDPSRDLKQDQPGIDSDGNGIRDQGEICWSEGELHPAGSWGGSDTGGSGSILVVQGNLIITGNMMFKGIIWVTGDLDVRGTMHVDGSIFVEGNLTSSGGTADLYYNTDAIINALKLTNPLYTPKYKLTVLSWKELVD